MKILFPFFLLILVSCIPENDPPHCEILSPKQGEEFTVGTNIEIRAEVSDDGDIDDVRLFVDDIGIASIAAFPFSYTLSTADMTVGSHSVKVEAIDNYGKKSEASVNFSLTATLKPTCVITMPEDSARFILGDDVEIRAVAIDEDGEIAEVRFYVNGILLATDGAIPYTYTLSTTDFAVGNYVIHVEAIDNSRVASSDTTVFVLMPQLPVVETATTEPVNSGSVLLEGRILDEGGGNISAAGFLWGLEPDGSDFTDTDADIRGNAFSVTITDLEYRTYYFMAYAENETGRSFGDMESFNSPLPENMFIDQRDGTAYEWVRIGNQIWMAENLAYLPELRNPSNSSVEEPFYYVYEYFGFNPADAVRTENYNAYGVLYNYTAAHDACPDGWHLPTTEEEKELITFIGGNSRAADLMETGTGHWNSNPSGTNATGFSARGAGRAVVGQTGTISFEKLRDATGWWRADTCTTDTTFGLPFVIESSDPVTFRDNNCRSYANGYSVRCVKD